MPIISCPASQVVNTTLLLDTATVTLENVTMATDNDGPPTITILVDGNEYNVGDSVIFNLAMSPHEVTYVATDAAGNTTMCNITVTVEGKNVNDPERSVFLQKDHKKPVNLSHTFNISINMLQISVIS